MKRPGSARKPSHVVWDEHNLQENDKIKAQLSTVKIDEPKTPYHGPVHDDDLDGDMKPLTLDDTEPASTSHVAKEQDSHSNEGGMSAGHFTYHPDLDAETLEEQNGRPSDSGFSSDHSAGHCSGGSDDDSKYMKRRRFEAMRRAHYNMKAALQHVKDDEEEEDALRSK